MKKNQTIFAIVVLIYSCYDYFEHILRPNSTFEAHPLPWLYFTTFSVLSAIFIILTTWLFLVNRFNVKGILAELAGIALWIVMHIYLLGPLYNLMFWPYDELYFHFSFTAISIILGAYFAVRLLIIWMGRFLKLG